MTAAYEPTDEECEWKTDEEEELTVSKQVQVTYTTACFLSPFNPITSVHHKSIKTKGLSVLCSVVFFPSGSG